MSQPINATPWGLGWASRLGGANLQEALTPSEAYAVILYFGLLASSVPVMLTGSAVLILWAHNVPGGVATAGGATLNLVCMLVVATNPRWYRPAAFLVLIFSSLGAVLTTYHSGGIIASGFFPLWLLIAPVMGTLVLGSRGGLVLLAFSLSCLVCTPLLPMVFGPASGSGTMPVEGVVGSLGSFGIVLFLALNWFIGQRRIVELELEREHARMEELLHNVLPSEIADRLQSGEAVARFHEEVSVLFADLVGFTKLSQDMSATRLVKMLDGLFGEFDALAEQHGLCKIKTIGDCYMVAGGVPTPAEDHAERLARFALAMRDTVAGRSDLALRIGIDSGPVVAGVIGKKRFLFDLWGDTVNTASRMESHGEQGRIQVTARTKWLLNDTFTFEDRGEIQVKGKGLMRTYFLEGHAESDPGV